MKKTITVTVDLEGKVEISMAGYKGKGCLAASKFIEDALGIGDKGRKFKPEFHQTETVKQSQTTTDADCRI